MSNLDDYTYPLTSVMYGSYVKMDRLSYIVHSAFSNSSLAAATKLNIYVDVYSIIHQIFSEHMRTIIENYTDITSCLINLCTHYRSFFRRLGVETNFFLVLSMNACDINRKFIAGYNETFYQKCQIPKYKKLVEDNIMLMKLLCPYLPGIHFVHSPRGYESSVVMAHLIGEVVNDGAPTMIISRDLYPLQLTTMFPNTTYLYPLKKKGEGDLSILIPLRERADFREKFWELATLYSKAAKKSSLVEISPVNYSLLNAISMFRPRKVLSLYNMRSAFNIITELVGSDDIKISMSLLKQSKNIANKYNVYAIETRYKALDVNEVLPWYKNDPESKDIQILDLEDNNKLSYINAKYFERNPIDLLHL